MKQENIAKVWDYYRRYTSQYHIWYPQLLKAAIQKNIDGDFSSSYLCNDLQSTIHLEIQRYIKYLLDQESQELQGNKCPQKPQECQELTPSSLQKNERVKINEKKEETKKEKVKTSINHKQSLHKKTPRHPTIHLKFPNNFIMNATILRHCQRKIGWNNGAGVSNKSRLLDYFQAQPIDYKVNTATSGWGLKIPLGITSLGP